MCLHNSFISWNEETVVICLSFTFAEILMRSQLHGDFFLTNYSPSFLTMMFKQLLQLNTKTVAVSVDGV